MGDKVYYNLGPYITCAVCAYTCMYDIDKETEQRVKQGNLKEPFERIFHCPNRACPQFEKRGAILPLEAKLI